MYALQMQTACQGEGSGDPEDASNNHRQPETTRSTVQDCSSFDIVRATQVIGILIVILFINPYFTENIT